MPSLRHTFFNAVAHIPSFLAACTKGIPKHGCNDSAVMITALSAFCFDSPPLRRGKIRKSKSSALGLPPPPLWLKELCVLGRLQLDVCNSTSSEFGTASCWLCLAELASRWPPSQLSISFPSRELMLHSAEECLHFSWDVDSRLSSTDLPSENCTIVTCHIWLSQFSLFVS